MRKVLLFSLLLVGGLVASQLTPGLLGGAYDRFATVVRLLTMACLSFIMIHVGYEFDLERNRLRSYTVDYLVAATAAAFPWLFCALYFILVMLPPGAWSSFDHWQDALLASRFAAPTSAGVLFSMLAAAGLSATWLFRKARILAIFDDLDTVLLMIPLKMMIVGVRWQLGAIVFVMGAMLWIGWRWLHAVRLPVSWPWVLSYAAAITAVSEIVYRFSKLIDDVVPVHIEVLLPAFVLGAVLARPAGADPHRDDTREGHQEGPEDPAEQKVSTIVSAAFMVLVGLSMPRLVLGEMSAGTLLAHTLALTFLSNLGKMAPLAFYRQEAGWRVRLALCIGMWPRGEVGAGVLVISLAYGISGTLVAAATMSLALNLLATGLFILAVRKLIAPVRGDA